MLRVHGVGWKIVESSTADFLAERACVRVETDASEWFPVNVLLRQGCVMSPWVINVYMDGMVSEVNARVLRRGL